MLFLDNDDVARVIDMPLCLESLEGLFRELGRGDAVGMGRMDMYVPSGQEAPYHRLALMVGGSRKDGYACIRIISDMVSWPLERGRRRENKYAREPGTYCGLLLLLSTRVVPGGHTRLRAAGLKNAHALQGLWIPAFAGMTR